MEFRSSNTKYVHFGGDLITNVDDASSYGVHLTGGSTAAIVQPAGDTTNIELVLRGLGTGAVRVGNSSQTVHVNGPLASSGTFAYTGSSFSVTPVSTGGITLGNSSNPVAVAGSSISLTSTHVNINSSRIVLGASTTPLILMQRSLIQFTIPALSSGGADETVEVAVTGLTTNAMIFIQQRQPYNSTIVAGVDVKGYCSTAGALRLAFFNNTLSTLSGSTASAYLWRFECPVAV